MKKMYSLYDGNVAILQSVPATQIREYLNMPSLKMADYTREERLVNGRYRITDDGVVKKVDKQVKSAIPVEMWKKWEEVCNRLKGVCGLENIVLVPKE